MATPVRRVLIALALPLGAALAMWGPPIAASATAFTVSPWAFACGQTNHGNPATATDPGGTGCPTDKADHSSYCSPDAETPGTSRAEFAGGTLTLTKAAAQCDFVSAGTTIGGLSTLTAAGFDVSGDVGGGSPRLNVVAADGFHFVSCPVADGHATCDVSAVAHQTIASIDIVFDTMGTVVLSNLSFTGTPTVVSTVRFGPFAGGSPDSGACGGNWANDTFQRTFTVTTFSDGTQTLRQDYTGGAFTTVEGKSPGACEAGPDNGGTVVAGITGGFTGFTSGTLTCGEGQCTVPNPGTVSPECPAPNVTACFVNAIFGANAAFNVSTFKFNYTAGCGYFLAERAWQNADPASGGNVGDIKSAPGAVDIVPCPPAPAPAVSPAATPTPTPAASPSGLPGTGPTTSPTSTAAVSQLATTGGGSHTPWSGLALLLGLGLLLALGGGVVVARTQFRRF